MLTRSTGARAGRSHRSAPPSDTGQAKFSRCTGGNAANGGDFERATDPWVSFSPNGVAQQVALSINDSNVANAVLTSRSFDKGANWEDPVVVKFDDRANFFNDKETITADPTDSRFVYVTWQRIVAPNLNASARAGERAASFRSIAWFARSDDNGASYDVVKPIFDPGKNAQTIGNQIVVLPNGDLVMLFNLIRNVGAPANRGFTAAVMRSTDKGDTWSAPIRIDRMITDGVTDPADGHAVRTGDLIPQIAVDDETATSTWSGRTIASPARSRSRSRGRRTVDDPGRPRAGSARSGASTRRSLRPCGWRKTARWPCSTTTSASTIRTPRRRSRPNVAAALRERRRQLHGGADRQRSRGRDRQQARST